MVDSRDRIKSSRTVSPTSEIKLGDLYTIEMNRKCFGVGSVAEKSVRIGLGPTDFGV